MNVKLERKQDERCWENTLAKKKRTIEMNMKRQYIDQKRGKTERR